MAVLPLEEPRPRIEIPTSVRLPVMRGTRPPSRRLLAVTALLALAACIALVAWRVSLRPVTVAVAGISRDVPLQVFGLGTVGARVQSNVGFKVAGVLVGLAADAGDHVRAGAVLARLDARDIEAQLVARAGVSQAAANIGKASADVASAQASLANAEAVSARRATLARSGFASKEEAQTTDAAMRVARANLDVANSEVGVAQRGAGSGRAQQAFNQATLDNYTLARPYDALVVSRNLQLGSMPMPGQSVFTLVEPRTRSGSLAYVDERLAGRLERRPAGGDRAALRPGGAPVRPCRTDRDPERSGERGAAGRGRLRPASRRTSIWPNRPRCSSPPACCRAPCWCRRPRCRASPAGTGTVWTVEHGHARATPGVVRAGTAGRPPADREPACPTGADGRAGAANRAARRARRADRARPGP